MAESGDFTDYYALLSVPIDAEPAAIRTAFIRLAKEHHPDRGGSTEQMQQFTKAYRTLMSATGRKAYDRLHDFHTGSSPVQYRDYGTAEGTAANDLTDNEIDDFLDTIFAEYHTQPKPKKTLFTKLKDIL